MRNEKIVIDGVGHTYDFSQANRFDHIPTEVYEGSIQWLYGWGHKAMESLADGYLLTPEEFGNGWTTEELQSLFFIESDVDVVAMHCVDFFDIFKMGANPWPQARALKAAAPERVLLYAACNPLADRNAEFERMAKQAEEGADAFKFYPVTGRPDANDRAEKYLFSDESIFPFFEHARSLGIKHLAIHKAVPTVPGSMEQDRPGDVTVAAGVFPDMTFEVVHSGWAFLEDCAFQMQVNANIYANLECTANTVVRMPRRFAKSVGLLLAAAPDRVLFATGAPLAHPQPIIEAIDAFVMPEDLIQEGLPEFTDQIKADLLGGNLARLHGLDSESVLSKIAGDEFSTKRAEYLEDPRPWHLKKQRMRRAAK